MYRYKEKDFLKFNRAHPAERADGRKSDAVDLFLALSELSFHSFND